MLDIERGIDVDAGGQQCFDILPALRVPAAGDVAVGEFVDDDQRRLCRQRRIEVELGQCPSAVLDCARRQDRQPVEQRGGLDPAMGLGHADQHVGAGLQLFARGGQHRVGLADAGAGAEEDFQLAAGGAFAVA